MSEQPVKGEEALRRMAARALNRSSNSPRGSEEEKDPLEEAQKFTKQMAASTIIESTVAKSKAEAEEAKARAEEAKAKARRAESGTDQSGGGPFQVKGGINLGTIDLQQEREEARAELERMKKEADESARATGQENQQLHDKIHEQEIKMLQITFQAQMESLTKVIERMGSQKSFTEQYTEAMETAKSLGFQLGTPQPGSEQIQLELKKLDFEHQRVMREIVRADKAEERRWQMELRRLDDERDARKAELAQRAKRDEMIASAPQMVGTAIGRAVMESKGEGEVAAVPKGKTAHHIEAAPGDSGETNCPECNEIIGIGPTARAAVCPKCGLKIPIKRVGEKPSQATEGSGERHREEE